MTLSDAYYYEYYYIKSRQYWKGIERIRQAQFGEQTKEAREQTHKRQDALPTGHR